MFAQTNGVRLFYEKTGNGRPLILLHGNGEDHHIFDKTVEYLKGHFTVYAVDTRGHGESSPVSAFHYQEMVEDIFGFISLLQIHKPILCGFSDGGITGLLLAIQYPDVLSHLVICGANTQPGGLKRQWLFLFKGLYMVTKDEKCRLMIQEPDITSGMLHTIHVPVHITAGSRDIVRRQHTQSMHENIPGSTLRIFERETHSSYIVKSIKLAQYMMELFASGQAGPR